MVRLLHISDLHFGPPHVRRFADAVCRTVDAAAPDAVVISGDIVEFAEQRAAWREAAAFMQRLSCPVAIVPGNHDIERVNVLRRLHSPLSAYRRYIRQQLDHVVQVPGAVLVCLATPRRWTFDLGHVSKRQLAWASQQLEKRSPEELRVVVMHHGLRQLGRSWLRDCVRGNRRVITQLTRHGVDLVLTGHNHYPHVERLGEGRGLVWAQAGTATTRRYQRWDALKPSITSIVADAEHLRVTWCYPDPTGRLFSPGAWHRFERSSLLPVSDLRR